MYHVHSFAPGLYVVGEGTPGVDWEPVEDFEDYNLAQADAERRNSPYIYALLETARRQIDTALARLEKLEKIIVVVLEEDKTDERTRT